MIRHDSTRLDIYQTELVLYMLSNIQTADFRVLCLQTNVVWLDS
jgi:hypothetical protein